MMRSWYRIFALIVVASIATRCGGGALTPPPPGTITISSYAYNPSNLSVKAGTTVTVTNLDTVEHTLTSQSTATSFQPGAVNGVMFDTGSFSGTVTFTIPSSAPVGTVIPYYCTVHGRMMGTGQITIAAP
jgi:plastocyanin